MLYSVGKDSSVVLHLLKKAFSPAKIPVPLLHIDTGYKFPSMYAFRDQMSKDYNFKLIVHRNEEAISKKANPWDLGTQKCCALLKTKGLLSGLEKYGFDGAIGGARRDEEKSRAKERFFSFRDKNGVWDPRNQRPELWHLYNTNIDKGESIRIFPISNWTELDVWLYIKKENIPIVPIYYAKERDMVVRGELLIEPQAAGKYEQGEVQKVLCRYRSLGCMPCTGAIRSSATTIDMIINELKEARFSERITRVIDHDTAGSMEKKKREGYF